MPSPVGALVDDNGHTLLADTFGMWASRHLCRVLSDGGLVAIYQAEPSTAAISVNDKPNGGSWGTPSSLIANATTLFSDIPTDVVQISDTVHLWTVENATLKRTRAHGSGAATASMALTTVPGYGASTATPAAMAATYNNSLHWVVVQGAAGLFLLSFNDTMVLQSSRLIAGLPSITQCRLSNVTQASSTMYLTAYGAGTAWYCIPITSGTPGTVETIPVSGVTSITTWDTAFDNTGKLDLAFGAVPSSGVGCVAVIKRTGSSAYSAQRILESEVHMHYPSPVAAYHSSTDDLWVVWPAFQSGDGTGNGEIHIAKRGGGAWGPATPLLTIDGASLPAITTAPSFNGDSAELLYIYDVGSGAPYALYEYGADTGAAPNTPSGITPSGYVGTVTPTIGWTYSNAVPTDGQASYEIRVLKVSDSSVQWRSGQVAGSDTSVTYGVTSNTGDANYHAPASLVKGTQYSVQVRVWDTVLSSVSSWSAAVNFTPIDGPAPTIDSITAGGATESSTPATILGPALAVAITHHQAQGHSANAYKLTLQRSGVTVASITGALSPVLTDGSSLTLPTWTPAGIADSVTYTLTVTLTDSTTGVTGTSSAWTITTDYAPPTAPTAFRAVPKPDLGALIRLSWTNDGDAVSNTVYRRTSMTDRKAAGAWMALPKSGLFTTLLDWPPLSVSLDYAVTSTDSLGIESAKRLATGLTTGLPYGHYPTTITDVSDPENTWVAVGMMDSGGWGAATEFDHNSSPIRQVYQGRKPPVTSYGTDSWWNYGGRTVIVPDDDYSDTSGAYISGEDVMDTLEGMTVAHGPYLVRTVPRSVWRVMTLENLKNPRADETAWAVQFDLNQEDTDLTALVV